MVCPRTIYKIGYRYVRINMLLLLLLSSVSLSMRGEHYIRLNADFSYARDFAGKGVSATPIGSETSLDAAQAWIGAGTVEPLSKSNGFAPAIGVGYRFKHKILIVDAGLGCEYRMRFNGLDSLAGVKAEHVDEWGETFIGTHSWTNRSAKWQNVGIQVPVMAGVEIKRFYVLAGIKANVDLWGTTREKGAYTMTGKYVRFMDELEDVPGHGLVSNEAYEMPAKKIGLWWDIRACLDLGYCIYGDGANKNKKQKIQPRYYVGAFAEYSFLGGNKQYLPLLAGVRLTVLLPLQESKECMCWGY